MIFEGFGIAVAMSIGVSGLLIAIWADRDDAKIRARKKLLDSLPLDPPKTTRRAQKKPIYSLYSIYSTTPVRPEFKKRTPNPPMGKILKLVPPPPPVAPNKLNAVLCFKLARWAKEYGQFLAWQRSFIFWRGIDLKRGKPISENQYDKLQGLHDEAVLEGFDPEYVFKPKKLSKNDPQYLEKTFKIKNLEVVDKRSKKGCLWVVGGRGELKVLMKRLAKDGFEFVFAKNGSRSTKFQPSWFLKPQG